MIGILTFQFASFPKGRLTSFQFIHHSRKLKPHNSRRQVVSERQWKNSYQLSQEQLNRLEEAEESMEMLDLDKAEEILLEMLEEDINCIPVLNNLGHMNGRYLSDFEKAIEYYERVLEIEPDNAWARDERRRYARYLTYD